MIYPNGIMESSVNPCPPEDLDKEDTTLLRGDAIGDTAYTHRWVLRCLYTITKAMPKYIRSLKDEDNEINPKEDLNEKITLTEKVDPPEILELDSILEDAACQLWDMTVEKSVTNHLLELKEVDIIQLAVLVFQESLSPRLTEIMIGVIANMCCQEQTCERVLEKKDNNELLISTVALLGESSDVPTICEILRFLKLLLWHRINRTSNSTWASCPLIKLLCQDFSRTSISFLLNNSLSDPLISYLLEVLSSFLFISLPETGLNVASLFSVSDVINGFLNLLKLKSELIECSMEENQNKIINETIVCLYAFIDTPGARVIVEEAQTTDSAFESNLLKVLEHEGHVESCEELEGEAAERLGHIIGLFQLLIPHLKMASSLMTIGRLLALIYGQTHQYSATSEGPRKGRSNSAEDMNFVETVETAIKCPTRDRTITSTSRRPTTHRQFSNPPIDEGGWLSPLVPPKSVDSPLTQEDCDSEPPPKSSSPPLIESKTDSDETSIAELKENIENYCYQLLAWYWSHPDSDEKRKFQTEILDSLDQCHAHEVLFILKTVRTKDPRLVPRLQEQLLDKGSHQRLVKLLAFMYQ